MSGARTGRWERAWIGTLAVGAFLVLWESAPRLGWIPVSHVSRPTLVALAFGELLANGDLAEHLGVSVQEFVYGFAIALVIGVPLGLVLGRYRRLGMLLDPLLMAFYATPRLALLPTLVVWFGVGLGATTAVVCLGAVFPILVNTMVGIRGVDPVWVRAVRSFGGNEWDIFTKVLVPGALPAMVTGIRLGIGRGILGMVVGEMYAASAGLGSLIYFYGSAFRTDHLIALIALVSLSGWLCVDLVRRAEERLWRGREGV